MWPIVAGQQGIAFLAGKTIAIEQTRSGEVVNVSGLAPIYGQALRELPLDERQPVERFLRDMAYNPRGLLGLGVVFPQRALRVGERWLSESGPFPVLCGQLAYRCNYFFRETSGGETVVEFIGEFGEDESKASSRMRPLRTAKVQGSLCFDPEKGIMTAMRGESSSFLQIGGEQQLRARTSWELALQGEQ